MLRVWGRKYKIIFELMRVDSFNKISILNEWGFSDSNMKTGAHIAQDSQPGVPYNYLSHFRLYILVVTLRTFSQQNWLDTDADGHHHIKRGLRVIEWNKYLLILQQSLLFTKQSSIHWKIWEKVVKGNRSFHKFPSYSGKDPLGSSYLSIYSAINLNILILYVERLKMIGFWDLYVCWQKQFFRALVGGRV